MAKQQLHRFRGDERVTSTSLLVSNGHMLLRRKQKPADFSKLSAQLVELSLQEAQRDPTLRGAVPNKLSAASLPLLWPSPDVQRIAQPPAENTGGPGTAARKAAVAATAPLSPPQAHGTPRELRLPGFAVLYSRAMVNLRGMTSYSNEVPRILGSWLAGLRVSGSVAVGNLRVYWKSMQKDHRLATLRARVLGRLTIEAQRTAVREPLAGLVHHSDRGLQYASAEYVAVLEKHGMIPSMSRPANPYDNASCESFLKTLKREEIYANQYSDLEHLRSNIEKFIERYYNRQRLHSGLGYCSPEEFEQQTQHSDSMTQFHSPSVEFFVSSKEKASTEMLGKGIQGHPLPQTPSPASQT